MTREQRRLAKIRRKNLFQFLLTVAAVGLMALYLVGAVNGEELIPGAGDKEERSLIVPHPEVVMVWEDPFEEEKIQLALLAQKYLSDEIPLSYDLQDNLRTLCDGYDIPYSLALAVIQTESSFRQNARNGSCYGLMQINTTNLGWLSEEIGVTDLTDPLQNIRAGTHMLADLYRKYGDWSKALIAYNAGEGGAYTHYFQHGYTTSNYSRVVMTRASEWEKVVG